MAADAAYAALALRAIPRLIGKLDREPHSVSHGSFDREHWSWKFRDSPIGPLQMGMYPLALLWRHRFPESACQANERLRAWIVGAIGHTLARQKRNGAFEAFAPNDFDPGPTLGICYALASTARLMQRALAASLHARLVECVRRGAEFGSLYEQTHGFASNHWALFACAYMEAADLTGESRYRKRGQEIVARILDMQSSDGWYSEYGGADPGYESLGIAYLARYWSATRDVALFDSLCRAIDFFAHCVHPDGSVGGVYGSRHTQLYFPAGFERLAGEIPQAAAVARFMGRRLTRGGVVTPANADAHNLIPLVASYLEAALVARDSTQVGTLPCEMNDHVSHFSDSGISTVGTPRFYAVINARKGGVCRIFDKERERLNHEDAGYIAHSGRRRWVSQTLGFGKVISISDESLTIEARFSEGRELVATPANYLILRILSFTLFRSVSLGAWIRDRIVRRLTSARRPGPLVLRRSFAFERDAIVITDELKLADGKTIDTVTPMRAHTGIHMGSAKYYHPSDLQGLRESESSAFASELTMRGEAHTQVRLSFAGEPAAF